MAEFQKVMQERRRMCDSYLCCWQCRINAIRNDICEAWIARNPKEAEQIIMEWSEAHPILTNAMKFEQVFGIKLGSVFPNGWNDMEYKGGQDND